MVGENPARTGRQVMTDIFRQRLDRADALRAERKRIRGLLAKHPEFERVFGTCNDVAREIVNRNHRSDLPRLHASEMFRLAIENRDFAESRPAYGSHDTEYYSACGYDDYLGALRDGARTAAVEYFRAWRTLKQAKRRRLNVVWMLGFDPGVF